MAETNSNQQQQQSTKIVSMGKPQVGIPAQLGGISELENIESKNDEGQEGKQNNQSGQGSGNQSGQDNGSGGGVSGSAGAAGNSGGEPDKSDLPELTSEQIKKLFGFDGTIDELKAKIEAGKQTNQEPTEEEKAAKEKVFEQRVMQKFFDNKGTPEQYVALKSLANAKPEEISLSEVKRELKEAGFNNDEAEALIKEHYFLLSDDEIAQYEDETDREFAKRKKDYGAKRLAGRATGIIKQAQDALKTLRDSVEADDFAVSEENKLSSTVDEAFSKLPRKITFQLGEVQGTQIAPIEFDVEDADINRLKSVLKDPKQRKQFLYNEDGTLNINKLSEVFVREAVLEKAVKNAYHTGSDRQVDEFRKTFPDNPRAVGLSNAASKSTNGAGRGKLVSAGKAVLATPQRKQQ